MAKLAASHEPLLPVWTVVGFTGHRKIDQQEVVAKAIDAVLARLRERQNAIVGITSLASGADTIFVEALVGRALPYSVILPFQRARFQADFSEEDWQRVVPLMDAALDVEELGESESSQESYSETGSRIVDESDVLIAVLDPGRPGGVGGTKEVVAYASALNKPLILIHPETGVVTETSMASLRPPASPDHTFGPMREAVLKVFSAMDADAVRTAPKARYLVFWIILLHLISASIAVTALALHWDGLLATFAGFMKVGALAYAFFLTIRHHHAHHDWLHSRVAAEVCRTFLAIWPIRRRFSPLPTVIPRGCEGLYRSLKMAWLLDRETELPLSQARDGYINGRVSEQITYFDNNSAHAERRYRLLRRVASVCTVGAIACAIVAMFLTDDSHGKGLAKLLSIILPLANAAALSLVVAQDLGRRAIRYREIADRLRDVGRGRCVRRAAIVPRGRSSTSALLTAARWEP